MPKIALPFVLILILVGIGYFLGGGADCDGKVVFADSGPDIPPGDEKVWLDTGNGWLDLSSQEFEALAMSSEALYFGMSPESLEEKPYIVLTGNTVRCGARFSPNIHTEDDMNFVRSVYRTATVKPIIKKEDQFNGLFTMQGGYFYGDAVCGISPDKSDLRENRYYVYIEFENLPASPTGLYAFSYGVVTVLLRQA